MHAQHEWATTHAVQISDVVHSSRSPERVLYFAARTLDDVTNVYQGILDQKIKGQFVQLGAIAPPLSSSPASPSAVWRHLEVPKEEVSFDCALIDENEKFRACLIYTPPRAFVGACVVSTPFDDPRPVAAALMGYLAEQLARVDVAMTAAAALPPPLPPADQ